MGTANEPGSRTVLVAVVAICAALGILVWWASFRTGSYPARAGGFGARSQQALRKIEELGGDVPHDWVAEAGPDERQPVYWTEFLDITLGSEWKGGNDGLAYFADVELVYELILDNPAIDDEGLRHLKTMRLEGLTAKGTIVTDTGLAYLEGVRDLELVRLDGSGVTDAGLASLENHDLKWLILENDLQVTDAGVAHLARMTHLLWLELRGANIKGPGLAHLRGLKELRNLVLAGTQVDDESLAHLASLERLQRLNLSGTQVRGPGLAHLKPLRRLDELYLDDTAFSDEGIEYLADLDRLVFVSLKGTQVTEAGLEKLHSMPRLKTVLLDGDRVDELRSAR